MSHHPHDPQQDDELLQHFRQHSQGEPSAAIDALILAAAREAIAPQPAKPDWSQRLHAWLFGPGGRTRWSAALTSLAIVGIGLSLTWRTQEQAPALYDAPAPMAMQAPAPAPLAREMAPAMAESRKQSADVAAKKAEEPTAIAESIDADAAYAPAPSMARLAAPAKPAPAPSAQAMADAMGGAAEAQPDDQARAVAKEKAAVIARSKAEAQAEAKVQGNLQGQKKLAEEASLQQRLLSVLQLRRDGHHDAAERVLAEAKKAFPQADVDAELRLLEQQKPGSSR